MHHGALCLQGGSEKHDKRWGIGINFTFYVGQVGLCFGAFHLINCEENACAGCFRIAAADYPASHWCGARLSPACISGPLNPCRCPSIPSCHSLLCHQHPTPGDTGSPPLSTAPSKDSLLFRASQDGQRHCLGQLYCSTFVKRVQLDDNLGFLPLLELMVKWKKWIFL